MLRRHFLQYGTCVTMGLLTPAWSGANSLEPGALEERVLQLEGDRRFARTARLLLPRRQSSTGPLPLLVLLHGLGETKSEQAGLIAWSERYGLVSAYERLLRPPVARTLTRAGYLTDTHIAALNGALEGQPFSGMALVCPITPNVYRQPSTKLALDRYADWIDSVLLSAVREAITVSRNRLATAIDGCSLGGFVALEVFLRKPGLFGSVGMVQGAIGAGAAERYADDLARAAAQHGDTSIRLGTSTLDPYRSANEELARQLRARSLACALEVHPGPHDQPWLREVGTLSMLHWHDSVFANRSSRQRTVR